MEERVRGTKGYGEKYTLSTLWVQEMRNMCVREGIFFFHRVAWKIVNSYWPCILMLLCEECILHYFVLLEKIRNLLDRPLLSKLNRPCPLSPIVRRWSVALSTRLHDKNRTNRCMAHSTSEVTSTRKQKSTLLSEVHVLIRRASTNPGLITKNSGPKYILVFQTGRWRWKFGNESVWDNLGNEIECLKHDKCWL